MFQMQGGYWERWNKRFRDAVVAMQIKDGNDAGSWNHSVLQTSMYLMSLEVYYRFLPVNK